MPRSDPSFTDADLLRFYCKNLNPSEKYLVLKRFNDFLSKGTKICPDDPDERIDPCEWIAFARKLVAESADLAKILSKFVLVIAALEVALGALSWVGPAAKILRIIIIVLGYIEAVLFFVTAILLLISELDPFLRFLQAFFVQVRNHYRYLSRLKLIYRKIPADEWMK